MAFGHRGGHLPWRNPGIQPPVCQGKAKDPDLVGRIHRRHHSGASYHKIEYTIQIITLKESVNALTTIRKEKPDLVILDWMMPQLSGIELCQMIKADPELKDIPIFMLTAKGQDSDEQQGIQCGVSRFITKPFSPRSLLAMVQEIIGKA